MINFLVHNLHPSSLGFKQSVQSCTDTELAQFQILGGLCSSTLVTLATMFWQLLAFHFQAGHWVGHPGHFWPVGLAPGAQHCETEKPPAVHLDLHHRGLSLPTHLFLSLNLRVKLIFQLHEGCLNKSGVTKFYNTGYSLIQLAQESLKKSESSFEINNFGCTVHCTRDD